MSDPQVALWRFSGALAAAAAAGVCALQFGGGDPLDLHRSLLLLAAGALVVATTTSMPARSVVERVAVWSALLFPAYVVLQLVPIPLPVLGILDPGRAAIAESLGLVGTAPSSASITIAPDKTWMHLPRIVGYTLAFLMAWQAARHLQTRWWAVALPLIGLGTAEAFVGLNQAARGVKVAGTYGSENHFAGLLEMTLPLALMLFVSTWHQTGRRSNQQMRLIAIVASGAATLAMFAAIPLSLSRAGFFSMLGSLIVVGSVALLPRATRWQRVGILAAVPALALIALIALPNDALISSLGNLKEGDGRWPVVIDSFRMFADFPLFGIGLGTYYPGFLAYQTTALNSTWTTAHNDYLQFLNELGLVGVIFPAVVMAVVVLRAYRISKDERGCSNGFLALGCLGGLSAMLFHSVADFNMYVPANAIVFMYIAGIAMGTGGAAQSPEVEDGARRGWALRSTCIGLCAWLVLNSVAWLAFLQRYERDPDSETAFCRIGVCNYYVTMAAVKAPYNDIAARTPPEKLTALLPRDAAGAYNWIDVGESLEAAGHLDVARASFTRGLELGPNIPFFLMRAANFFFRQGDYETGLTLTAKSFLGNAGYEQAAFTTYQQYKIPLQAVLELGLRSKRTGQAYLKALVREGNVAYAEKTWAWLAEGEWTDDALAVAYVDGLIAMKELERAAATWRAHFGGKGGEETGYVFNAGFERDTTDGLFDWRFSDVKGLTIAFDGETRHSGTRALRIVVDDAANPTDLGVQQAVYLEGGRYTLRAFVRTEGLTTDEGVRLAVGDQRSNKLTVATPDVRGTTGWTLVEQEFDAPEGRGLVWVRVARQRSFKFDRYVSGTAWVDDVSITRVPPA